MALATPSAQLRQATPPADSALRTAQSTPGVTVHRAQYSTAAPRYANPFDQYKAYLAAQARRAGVREATIQAVVPYLRLSQRAMELDRAQRPNLPSYSTSLPSFGPYITRHITTLADQSRPDALLVALAAIYRASRRNTASIRR